MFKHTYHTMNGRLAPDAQLVADTLRHMEDRRQGIRWVRPVRSRRFMRGVVAAVLILCVSLTVMFGAVPDLRSMLPGMGDSADALSTVVLAETENNGLRLEVLGTTNTEDTLSIYYTLRDVSGQGRLSRDMDSFTRVKLNGEFPEIDNELLDGAMWYDQVLHYDPDTQTALCRTDFDTNSTYDVTGAEVRLTLTGTARVTEKKPYIPIDLSLARQEAETLPVYGKYVYTGDSEVLDRVVAIDEYTKREFFAFDGFPSGAISDTARSFRAGLMDNSGEWCVLRPRPDYALPSWAEEDTATSADEVRITAVGFLGGTLHVQVHVPQRMEEGEFEQCSALVCADAGTGEELAQRMEEEWKKNWPDSEILDLQLRKFLGVCSFDLDEEGRVIWGPHINIPHYEEYVFQISPEELDGYEIFASCNTIQRMTADMQVTFPLGQPLPDTLGVYGPLLAGNTLIDKMEITPMGVFLTGNCEKMQAWAEGVRELELVCGEETLSFQKVEDSLQYTSTVSFPDDGGAVRVSACTVTFTGPPVNARDITGLRVEGMRVLFSPSAQEESRDTLPADELLEAGVYPDGIEVSGDRVILHMDTNGTSSNDFPTVRVECGGESIACEMLFGMYETACGGTEPGEKSFLHYKMERPADPAAITAVEINGIQVKREWIAFTDRYEEEPVSSMEET